MHYPETIEQAQTYALAALQRLKKLGLAANPQNYAIWYEYFAGKNADLRKSIDGLPEAGAADYDDLYQRYIIAGAAAASQSGWSDRVESAARQIVDALSATGSGTAEYGKALQTFRGGLTDAQDIDQIRDLVVNIIEDTAAMDSRTRELHRRVNDSASEIVELRQALEASRRDALTDALTGIANRKCFDQALFSAVAEAKKNGTALSLIIADLDHFKRFNDTHGHQLGDQVLRLVGKVLIDNVRGRDIAARYGGEEFIIILPETTSSGAAAVAENLRRSIGSRKLMPKGSDRSLGNITMSFGVTGHYPGEDGTELIARADRALYTAKKLGRNRVICEDVAHAAE